MKHIIIGTAGHIDHGKTALVKALTGIDTDRLKEEKERGITIDLGFAFLRLSPEIELGIIDVPGHEKFVKNMLAGVGGIDLALFVIAADEGVMPQTEEHLAICQLLQIQQGIVALTKSDLVDEEWLELVIEDVKNFIKGSFLEKAPIVPVSSKTGVGIDHLKGELEKLALQVQPRNAAGIFRLPIDRVFTVKGFGTVVTGTLVSGVVQIEDTLEVLPKKLKARVRGIQTYNQSVQKAWAGQRTALNLHGLEKANLERGDVLIEPDLVEATYMLDVHLQLLAKADKPLKNRTRVRFHVGTSEIMARIVLLDREELEPGQETFAQIHLEAPGVVLAGDRYVIRSYSPVITIGGGEILNPHPQKHKRFAPQPLKDLRILREGSLDQVIEVYARWNRWKPVNVQTLLGQITASKQNIRSELEKLSEQGKLVLMDPEARIFIHRDTYEELKGMVQTYLKDFHAKYPLKLGMSKEELRSKLPEELPIQIFNKVLEEQTEAGILTVDKKIVRLSTHHIQLSLEQEQIRRKLEEIYLSGGFQPPNYEEVLEKIGGNRELVEEIFQFLLEVGTLVRVREPIFYHRSKLEEIKSTVVQFLKDKGSIEVGILKDLLGISRKYAIPLLEYFDSLGLTIRTGDTRVLREL
ncbi:MAG TPA: selenocysteine-specific translation elongation factor [Candidatus Limnocylindrales bacterium]|nr:selenocysteine-specific translation elongation factor [Candidatus Limnocylindrales bacterium]